MADERAVRVASNEARFREINERLARDLEGIVDEPDELLPFVCECGLRTCKDPVRLSAREFRRVRREPTLFAIVPGHEIDDLEDVLEVHARYAVIRKRPETWPIVAGSQ
jgi:hypothetical protein